MSQILLGPSYFPALDPKVRDAEQPYAPLGTLLACAYLRARGYAVGLFDATLADSERDWEGALARDCPAIAVIFEDNFNYLSKMCLLRMRDAATAMIGAARRAGCVVIVCGADATDHPEHYLRAGAHFVIQGEGEVTLGELVDHLTRGASRGIDEIEGLMYLDPAAPERVYRTRTRPDLSNLDELPPPAWDLVDVDRYREIWGRRHGYFSMNVVTTRGCPYHCNWCAKPIWGQRYTARSPEHVAAEIAWLHEQYRPDHIWFADDILGLKPGWLQSFAAHAERATWRRPFKCLSRADLLLRDGEIDALRRAGADFVWMGAESGSQRVLDAMEKGIRVEHIERASAALRAAGMRVGFFLQFGYPGEGAEDIEATLALVRRSQPDDIGVSVSYPLPGTTFHARVRDQLAAQHNWVDSDDLAMLYRGTFGTAFYRQLHKVVHHEFRMRRPWRSRARQNADQVFRSSAREKIAAGYHWLALKGARRRLSRLASQV